MLSSTDQKPEDETANLTGVSDIVGELMARGEVAPEDLGLSTKEAQSLIDKAL